MANPIDIQLKSLRMLSLEDISLRKVAVLLCSDPVKYGFPISAISIHFDKNKASRVEAFKRTVAELGLPERMKDPLVNTMYPVFLETNKWLKFHKKILISDCSSFCLEYIKYIHWTHIGTISYRKTAEAMIRDEKLDIGHRFMLACLYCLEEDIQDIWQKLSPLSKEGFYNNGEPCICGVPGVIVIFWTCILKGRVDKLNDFLIRDEASHSSIYRYAFEYFASKGYGTATKYFFEKLTCEEKDVSLVNTDVSFAPCHDVYCYLLSQMNVEQLQGIFVDSSRDILKCFLDWPRQDAFLAVAKLVLPFFTKDDYKSLHTHMSVNFKYVYNAPKLFRDLFLITPKDFRYSACYLVDFFRSRDTESIQFMFGNMGPAERLEFVFSEITTDSCYELVGKEEWDFLEFYFRESRLSKEDMVRFEVAFNCHYGSRLKVEILQRFNKVLSDISTYTSQIVFD